MRIIKYNLPFITFGIKMFCLNGNYICIEKKLVNIISNLLEPYLWPKLSLPVMQGPMTSAQM